MQVLERQAPLGQHERRRIVYDAETLGQAHDVGPPHMFCVQLREGDSNDGALLYLLHDVDGGKNVAVGLMPFAQPGPDGGAVWE